MVAGRVVARGRSGQRAVNRLGRSRDKLGVKGLLMARAGSRGSGRHGAFLGKVAVAQARTCPIGPIFRTFSVAFALCARYVIGLCLIN